MFQCLSNDGFWLRTLTFHVKNILSDLQSRNFSDFKSISVFKIEIYMFVYQLYTGIFALLENGGFKRIFY